MHPRLGDHRADRWRNGVVFALLAVLVRVGCDGVVGSGVRGDACGVCGGDNTTCRVVSGIFTRPHLPQGLNVVALLPQSACNISIAQLRPTSNLLGLRRLGGRVVVWPGAFDVGGTHFAHSPADALSGETLTAPGPLTEPIELVLTYQQPNPGIKYEYSLPRRDPVGVAPTGVSPVGVSPVGVNSPNDIEVADPDLRPAMDSPAVQRGKGRRYVWRLTGLSDCSKSCGGGSQQAVVQCVRENTLLPVSEKRCQGQERPSSYSLRCGTRPCPAQWSTGDWSGCSVTCGSGTQTRELSCRQEISSALAVRVADGACLGAKPDVELVQPCRLPPCAGHHAHPHHHHHHHGSHHADTAGHPDGYPNLQDSVQGSLQADKDLHEMETTFQATTTMAPAPPTKSVVGPWSKCSSECGRGVRTRVVGCPAGASSTSCPAREEPCDAGPCPSDNNNNNQWLASEWSTHCSAECGAGVQSRSVVCPSGAALTPGCEPRSRPAHTRACSAESPHCRGQWFASPWGPCSATCGQGVQTRGVACVQWQRGQARYEVRNDGVCDSSERPDQQQPCAERACPPHWYAGEWSECSRSCGTGGQKREVRCIGPAGPSTACPESTKLPSRKACLLQDCRAADRDEQPADTQDEPADAGVICEDRLRNCHLVVQARLCKYSYYGSSCCHSCRRKGD